MTIESLELWTPDIDALRAFYGGVLGLPTALPTPDRLEVPIGSTALAFVRAPAGWDGYYHFAFRVPGNRFAGARDWLAARTAVSRDYYFENWDADAVYFDDPAGNIGELIAHRGVAERDAFELQRVVEIGMVVDDVLATVAALGIPAYRGGASAEFAAAGDADGMLIVVRRGRSWFGTSDRTAGPAPFTARLHDGRTIVG